MTYEQFCTQRNGQYCKSDADLLLDILAAAHARLDLREHHEESTMGGCYGEAT